MGGFLVDKKFVYDVIYLMESVDDIIVFSGSSNNDSGRFEYQKNNWRLGGSEDQAWEN